MPCAAGEVARGGGTSAVPPPCRDAWSEETSIVPWDLVGSFQVECPVSSKMRQNVPWFPGTLWTTPSVPASSY